MIEIFFILMFAHALCDYPLQGDFLAQTKNRNHEINQAIPYLWAQSLTAHSIIHGGAVALITGVWWLGALEAISHWVIDFLKCEKKISHHFDQLLHATCKFMWVLILSTL